MKSRDKKQFYSSDCRNLALVSLLVLLLLGACATSRPNTFSSNTNLTPGAQMRVYPGDTLYSFARRNNVSMRELIDLNHLQSPFELTPGTMLTLPAEAAPLPSVELGPAAVANELDYEKKHSGVTTYTQVVPERTTEAEADRREKVIYAPVDITPSMPAPLQAEPQKAPAKVQLAQALNLQPMQFDKNKKQLKAPSPDSKPMDHEVAKILKEKEVQAQTRQQKAQKVKVAPAPVQAAKDELTPPQFPQQDKPKELHSRIEKQNDPINLIWPVQGPVLSTFGPKSNGLSNDGINIGAPRATPVVAADGGTVAYAGSDIPGFGNVVLLRHASGLMTTYAHLERMFVQRDNVVAKGDLIGTVGTSGGLDTPQLHFEIRRDKEALDPGKYLYR